MLYLLLQQQAEAYRSDVRFGKYCRAVVDGAPPGNSSPNVDQYARGKRMNPDCLWLNFGQAYSAMVEAETAARHGKPDLHRLCVYALAELHSQSGRPAFRGASFSGGRRGCQRRGSPTL